MGSASCQGILGEGGAAARGRARDSTEAGSGTQPGAGCQSNATEPLRARRRRARAPLAGPNALASRPARVGQSAAMDRPALPAATPLEERAAAERSGPPTLERALGAWDGA